MFLVQGDKDAVAKLAQNAEQCLDATGGNAELIEYQTPSSREGYSIEMLEDTIKVLKKCLGERANV